MSTIKVLRTKIHRAIVTDANVDYNGSITIDEDIMDAALLHCFEQVDVVNVTNGKRLQTYAIPGKRGSGVICLNGAAAHKFCKGHVAIIMAYQNVELDKYRTLMQAGTIEQRIVLFNRSEFIDSTTNPNSAFYTKDYLDFLKEQDNAPTTDYKSWR